VFLLGDFNATAKEACISSLIEEEAGFSWLIPANGPLKTHPKVADAVDHIFVYPPPRVVEYRCWIVDTDTTRIASDHLPVIADVIVK
jgi:endonuclease/exonuclease/phosphatase family metal-dependent hydrolase